MEFLFKVFLLGCLYGSEARVTSSPRRARLTLMESAPSYYYTNIDGHPGTYAFGYDVEDPQTGNTQYRSEERYPNGTVVGSYGYVDSNGRPQRYKYVADQRGYRIMSDLPKQLPVPLAADVISELKPSVTWSRPKRPNKNKNNSYLTKIPVNKVNRNNVLQPPSYYTLHDTYK